MIQQEQPPPQSANPNVIRAQLVEVQARLAGLQAEYNRVHAQTQQASGFAVPPLQAREAEIMLAMARNQGELARLNELGKLQGITIRGTTEQPPHRNFLDRVDPEMIVGLSFLVLLALVIPLSIGFARRMMRSPAARTEEHVLGAGNRLDRLEQAVDSIAIEVERISEGQRYVTKLLAEGQAAKTGIEGGK